MRFHLALLAVCMFHGLSACNSGGNESVRGKTQKAPESITPTLPTGDSGDANADANPNSNQASVFVDASKIVPLNLGAEVDTSALPEGFMADIFAVHKISPMKTILFGKSKQSWLIDETRNGLITKLQVEITPPADSILYILENKNFWLINKASVAFPSVVPSEDPTQLTLINVSPEILKDPSNKVRVLFAGPQRLILATETRANIIVLDGDKAKVVALDFPKVNDEVLPIISGGLMLSTDAYWFRSADRIMVLKKNSLGFWKWVVNKFKLDGQVINANPSATHLAMVIEPKDERNFAFVGRTFELSNSKLYEQTALKLSIDTAPPAVLDPVFINQIQPLLKAACVSCHVAYDEFSVVKAKAAIFKSQIADGTMPKGSTLSSEQIKILTDYMTVLLSQP